MRVARPAVLLLASALGLMASAPDLIPDKSPTAALLTQHGITAKFHPGKDIGQDLDLVWADPSFKPARYAAGKRIAVYLFDQEGKPLTTADPAARAWAQGLVGTFRVAGANLSSDEGWLGDNWEFPTANASSGLGRTLLNQVAQGIMSADTVPQERAMRSPGEETEEKAKHDQEVATLGQDEADARAVARTKHLREVEDARLRHELLGGIKPTKNELLWVKERDEPLYQEALARDAHRRELAEKDTAKLADQAPWVLVATFQAQLGAKTIFSKDKATGTMILFQAGKPVFAAQHTNQMAGGTFGAGFGQAFTGKGGGAMGVAATNGGKLGDGLNGPAPAR